jgi:2-octaprenyl-6-methoxyphenol hydroxylase
MPDKAETEPQEIETGILVAGGGLAGLTAALALGRQGHQVVLAAPPAPTADGRTTALLGDSVNLLESLAVWQRIAPMAHALRIMRIIDATGRLLRAPQADFRAQEIGMDAFGYNVANADLLEALIGALSEHDNIRVFEEPVTGLTEEGGSSAVTLKDGSTIHAALVVAADGRNSVVRQSAGIGVRTWNYPQVAVVCNLRHTLPHHDISTEFHTPTGPFTVVPLGDRSSSLVCVEDAAGAERLMELDREALNLEIERRMQSILGKIEVDGKLQKFPLSGMMATKFAAGRTVLVGETSHVFPPIGAQGYNLSLRDVATLTGLTGAIHGNAELAERIPIIVRQYDARRRGDVHARTASVDLLNRSLLSPYLPVQVLRSLGIAALSSIGPLRRFAMREGAVAGSGLRGADPFSRVRQTIRRRRDAS